MSAFSGFSPELLTFLAQLSENNNREWFAENKTRYQELYLEPAKQFVTALGERFSEFAPDIKAEPRVNGSIFRINKDVRFSKDKRPYRDHLDFWFWRGDSRKTGFSGYFFRLRPDVLHIGAGVHGFEKSALERYRAAINNEASGRELVALLGKLKQQGYQAGGEHYKRVPRGFERDHPRSDLLRHNALYATIDLDPAAANVTSDGLLDVCQNHFEALYPLHLWLIEHVAPA